MAAGRDAAHKEAGVFLPPVRLGPARLKQNGGQGPPLIVNVSATAQSHRRHHASYKRNVDKRDEFLLADGSHEFRHIFLILNFVLLVCFRGLHLHGRFELEDLIRQSSAEWPLRTVRTKKRGERISRRVS